MAFFEMPFLDTVFYGNAIRVWIAAALTTAVAWIVLRFSNRVLVTQIQHLTTHTKTNWDNYAADALGETRGWILFLLALYTGSLLFSISVEVMQWISAVALIVFLIQVGIWGSAFINNWMRSYENQYRQERAAAVTTMRAVSFVGRLVLYSVLLLFALDNIPGVEVTTLIASLGIGGVAVALAVQSILGDLFASLSIAFDKPFVIGDFIIVGDYMGTVENIGLKTTRVRSLGGEQLIFTNTDLLESRVRNYQNMQRRRIEFSFGVTYDTPADQLRRIPEMVKGIMRELDDVTIDRVHFSEFGASALEFEAVYYVETADYNVYMDIQQALNLEIYETFENEGIEFAFPTQTIHLAEPKENGRAPQSPPQKDSNSKFEPKLVWPH